MRSKSRATGNLSIRDTEHSKETKGRTVLSARPVISDDIAVFAPFPPSWSHSFTTIGGVSVVNAIGLATEAESRNPSVP